MILLIDNYDSFVHNLARYFRQLGQDTRVVRNDAISVERVRAARADAVVLSPGPCTPNEAGISLDVAARLHHTVPLLGICLGHQAIAAALGGNVVRAPQPMHGRASPVHHAGQGIFAGLPSPLAAGRYHSLVVERQSLPPVLETVAWTDDGQIMAVEHRSLPVVGLQFHPESILTEHGFVLLANFLRKAGLSIAEPLPTLASELVEPPPPSAPLPVRPVTF
jgi:anthranilate synthase component II